MDEAMQTQSVVIDEIEGFRTQFLPPETRSLTEYDVLVGADGLTKVIVRATLFAGVDGGGAESLSLFKA